MNAAASKKLGLPSFIWPWTGVLATLILIPLATTWGLAPDLGHGWAAVILMGYLWYERWDTRPRIRVTNPGWCGWLWLVALGTLLVPLRLLLTPYPLWPMALLAYVAVLLGLLILGAWQVAGGAGVRWVAAPLIVLLGVIPWPGVIDQWFFLPLRGAVATVVAEISNLMGNPAVASGTSVQLAGGWVGIDEACGGIRSMQAAVMTALFFGVWVRLRLGRRIALVGVAVMAAVAGNFFRIMLLSWLATGRDGELEQWHDPAGWLALAISLGFTGWVGWKWRRRAAPLIKTSSPVGPPTAPSLRPIQVWAALSLGLLVGPEVGTRWWYARGDAEGAANISQWTVRLPTERITYRELPLSKSAEAMLRPDRFVSGSWIGSDLRQHSAYFIEWTHGQVARSVPFLHNPTVCLPYAGCELVRGLDEIQVTWPGGVIPFHVFLFRRMGEDMLVAFTIWDPSRGQELAETAWGWRSWWERQWRDVREARRHQPAQLFAYAVMGGGNSEDLAAELREAIRPVVH
ncbi:MAG: exosortase/archaeosortase family protein [Opitutaceae bacterium]|nr:exosortase/archaeosortase family protein [Opitutaceae bacterium]